jgi:SAM-dependent methyltransferase
MVQDRGYEKAAPFYDLFDNKDNIDFFSHYATRAEEILDIGAGTGRIAIPLAERGARVIAVEPSPAMRAQFREKLDTHPELQEYVTLIAGTAASFTLDRSVPAAFLSGGFDHFLDPAERLASLENIGCHLQVGGILVFDVFIGLMRDNPLTPTGEVKIDDQIIRRFVGSKILPDRRIEVTLVFETYQKGALQDRIEQRSWSGITDRTEVHRLLSQSGFVVTREFSDYQFTPFKTGDPSLIVEAVFPD